MMATGQGMRGKLLPLAIGVEILVLVADQVSKFLVLFLMGPDAIPVTPFFNLVLTYNRGVSFGLLSHEARLMPYVLAAVALAIVFALLMWLRQVTRWWMAVAIGLVMGGAVGNAVDRLYLGAVVDFLDFHVAGWHWPAFNIADSAICLGVAVMVYDSLFCSGAGKLPARLGETGRS